MVQMVLHHQTSNFSSLKVKISIFAPSPNMEKTSCEFNSQVKEAQYLIDRHSIRRTQARTHILVLCTLKLCNTPPGGRRNPSKESSKGDIRVAFVISGLCRAWLLSRSDKAINVNLVVGLSKKRIT